MSSKFGGKNSEGKSSGGKNGEEAEEDSPATIKVHSIRVDDDGDNRGSLRPLEDLLRLEIDFDSDTSLQNAVWNVKYMVDVVAKRYIVELGGKTDVDINNGSNTFTFLLDSINMSGIKRKHLINNAGLLIASLVTSDGQDVIDVNLVVQVSKSENGLVRHILNPLR
jgi:hypothetical protein